MVGMLAGYVLLLLLLSQAFKSTPVWPVCAIWSGLGPPQSSAFGFLVIAFSPAPGWDCRS